MSLGQAQTDFFPIGTAELRVGPMSSAGKLGQGHSVGLIDEASVSVDQSKVVLKGGYPKQQVASSISEQAAKISATLREYSRRNLNVMVGNGIPAAITAAASTVALDIAVDATSVTVASGTGFSAGDLVVIYQAGYPESVSIVKLTTVATNVLSFAANSLSKAYEADDGVIHAYKANETALGNVTQVNYFSAMLIQQGADGRPQVWSFWKAAVGGNMEYATNSNDYASAKLELDLLLPSAQDVAIGGPLNHIATTIASRPLGIAVVGA